MPTFDSITVQLLRDKEHWSLVGKRANQPFVILGVLDPPVTEAVALSVAQLLAREWAVPEVIDHSHDSRLTHFAHEYPLGVSHSIDDTTDA